MPGQPRPQQEQEQKPIGLAGDVNGYSLVIYIEVFQVLASSEPSSTAIADVCDLKGRATEIALRSYGAGTTLRKVANAASSDADGRCTQGGGYYTSTVKQVCMIR